MMACTSATIGELYSMPSGTHVRVVGVVEWVGRVSTVESWNGALVRKRSIEIVDSSWPEPVLVAFWGWAACRDRVKRGSVVEISARISEWNGLSLNAKTGPSQQYLSKNAADSVRRWYNAGKDIPRSSHPVKYAINFSKGASSITEWLPTRHVLNRARADPSISVVDSIFDSKRLRRRVADTAQLMVARYEKCGAVHVAAKMFSSLKGGGLGSAVRVVQLVCKYIVPMKMWGSVSNARAAGILVEDTLRGQHWRGREVVHRFRLSETATRTRSATQMWLDWYIADLIVPVCRALFFITPDGHFRLASEWRAAEIGALRKASHLRYDDLCVGLRRPEFARARFSPKSGGGGRVVQACTKTRPLRDAFLALRFETRRDPSLLGFGGPGGVDRLWRGLRGVNKDQRYHIAKVDVERCYDTMDQTRAFDVARAALTSDSYVIFSGSKKRARALEATEETRGAKRGRVVAKEDILQSIRSFIFEHSARLGKHTFRQIKGVAQGSVLSPILCDLYYGDIENRTTKNFSSPFSLDLAVRVVDDVLVAHSSLEKVSALVDAYGEAANQEKSTATFSHSALTHTAPPDATLDFCGIRFNCASLQVLFGNSMAETRKKSRSRTTTPSAAGRHTKFLDEESHFDRQLRVIIACRFHGVFFDTACNSKATIQQNLRGVFESAVDSVGRSKLASMKRRRLGSHVHSAARFAYSLYRRSMRKFNLALRRDSLRLDEFYRAAYFVFGPFLKA